MLNTMLIIHSSTVFTRKEKTSTKKMPFSILCQCKHLIIAIYNEAEINFSPFQYSPFLCVLALSSIVEEPIETYFPIACDVGCSEYRLSLSELIFNGQILPRGSDHFRSTVNAIHIFQCASAPTEYLYNKAIPERKEQFVPLMLKCQIWGISSSVKKRKLSKSEEPLKLYAHHLQPITSADLCKSSPDNQASLSVIPKPLILKQTGKKQKQILIDSMFTKKMESVEQLNKSYAFASSSASHVTTSTEVSDNVETPVPVSTTMCFSQTDIGNVYKEISSFSDEQ